MPYATYRGPRPGLRIRQTGTRLVRGAETQVTHREGAILADSAADVVCGPAADFAVLTVPELRRLCGEAGVPHDGTKGVLVERLLDTTVGDELPDPADV